VKFKINALVTD